MQRIFLPIATCILLLAALLRFGGLASYPPGPHFDEAANILITRSIAFGGANQFPITNSYQGRETLYHYLAAPLFQTIADDEFTLQLTSAFIGILTVAVSMTLGRVLFRGERGVIVGLLMGILLTVSFHHVLMSRQAYRAITLPLMQGIGLLFLWRGLRAKQHSWICLIVGGIFSGGALYTYMASRLFPLWLLLAGFALLWLDRAHFRRRMTQGLIFFGALGVTAVPIGMYALENPDIFMGRLNEVTAESDVVVSLEHSIRRHAEMFFLQGEDSNLRYNIPGRPYFTPLAALFLIVGSGVAVYRLWTHKDAIARTAYFIALLSPLMVIPSVISLGGFPPNHMRSLGMVPLIFVLPAIGAEWSISYFFRRVRLQQEVRRNILASGLLIIALIGTGVVASAYRTWVTRTDLFYQTDGDMAQGAEWLPAQVDDSTRVYVASFNPEHTTMLTGWSGDVTWLGSESLFLPAPDATGVYLIMQNADLPADWRDLLATGQLANVPLAPDNTPAFSAYRLQGNTIDVDEDTIRTPLMTFIDASAEPTPAGQQVVVTMRWRIDQTPPYNRLRPVVELTDALDNVLSRNDLFLLGTDQWRAGEVMIQNVPLEIPATAPPGMYTVTTSWVDRDSGTYVTYIGDDGGYGGFVTDIAQIEVIPAETTPDISTLAIPNRYDEEISTGVNLLGWGEIPAIVRSGGTLDVSLFWEATGDDDERATPMLSYTLGNGDAPVSLVQTSPLSEIFPVEAWQSGDVLQERVSWSIPTDIAGGTYDITIRTDDFVIQLGEIQVDSPPRVFDTPEVDTIIEIDFGDSLQLYGYKLAIDDAVIFEPVWFTHQAVETDYTVFVHIIDENGVTIAQRDVSPRDGSYPTSLWAVGEYIEDRYMLDLPPAGTYILRTGLYVQATGETLLPEVDREETVNFVNVEEFTITFD